jgi:dTDP-4-dehydrorhamnose reductase
MADKNMKLLLLGGSGLIGSAVSKVFAKAGYQILAPSHEEFDLTDLAQIGPRAQELAPGLIINCAGMLGHENCEQNPEAALQLNALAPKHLAKAAEQLSIGMLQISTSAVFNGRKKGPYNENDRPAPVNMYGGSKLLGENFVTANCSRAYILRLPMIFGPGGNNSSFIDRMAEKLLAGEELSGTTDEFNTPLFSEDVAKAINELFGNFPYGTYHLAGGEPVSLYALLSLMAELLPGAKRVEPVESRHFQRSCPVPLNRGLCSENLPEVCRPWQKSLPKWMSQRSRK